MREREDDEPEAAASSVEGEALVGAESESRKER